MSEEKKKAWVGIDPGKQGAIVLINEFGITTGVTPTIGKDYDLQKMISTLNFFNEENDVHVVLENINSHSAKGRQTAFVMGKGVAYWEMALTALKIPFTMVTPQKWQKDMWNGIPKQKNSKKTSLLAAKRIFPDQDFLASDRSSVPHDGIVDAMLMAEYCRRKIG